MKKKLVVLSGAGMSAESGIPTFRGEDGLWEGYSIEEVATPQAWDEDYRRVLDFYNWRRKKVIESEPNDGHRLLAELEAHFDIDIITQNIDDLHERAGSSRVLHLHGEIKKVRSVKDPSYIISTEHWEVKPGDVCPKGGQLRPHIVWFGEPVPMMEPAMELATQADLFLVIGTSLMVYPAAGLVNFVRPGTPIYLIDPELDGIHGLPGVTTFKTGGGEGMRLLMNELIGA
jgi:NAD-dependent deacetylase